ncbi:MAG: 4-hydroxy-tetrahydrodipicolinate synthase [Gammaproteobacteria bacterium]|nr:4-hydroxy-tetrahydrodipicolinate synthase [Gammaproteobacteria bacterium]MDH3372009.1 4-hydroxy-tetrahydrodipicolinate synthase [Gammaproteobacteria bacterium]MDH3408545.1 4-hydroxy-tetrahydrodipicolinate synthase [Gammaproteobacteria bacterium]
MFKGSLVALATPFDSDNRVDYTSLKGLIDFHVNEGTDGLVIAGTTGEAATLTKAEHVELIARAVEIVDGRLPVVAGTGSNSTQQTIDLSLEVGASGIDAYLVVVPYYNKPVQEGMVRHFTAVADAVEKPLMLYNVPGRTVADMQAETVARLAAHENIFGIKEATGDIGRLRQIQALVDEDFMLYSGDDFTALQFLEAGGHGIVTVSGNVVPAAIAGLCKLVAAGQHAEAKSLDDSLQPLNAALFVESNPIPVKWALSQMRLMRPNLRLPLTEFAKQYHGQMRRALAIAGVKLENAA